jgi:alkylhydroperoxidase family enzyme
MSPVDLDELRRHGFDDTAIHDATQVIAYFNYITRIADALGVEASSSHGVSRSGHERRG